MVKPIEHSTLPNPVDEVQISPEALALDKIRDLPDIRTEKVEMARQKIAAGEYDDRMLGLAVERMLDEVLSR